MKESDIRRFAATTPFAPEARQAFVVPCDVVFGLSRMYGTFQRQDPGRFQVFREVAEALRWLGFDAEDPV